MTIDTRDSSDQKGRANSDGDGNAVPLHDAAEHEALAGHEQPPTAPSTEFAHWLVGGLRPSSASLLPPATTSDTPVVGGPETLAPQVMPSEELGPEELAVLPGRRRSHQGTAPGKLAVAALGAAAAVLLFGYTWSQSNSHEDPTPVAAGPAAGVQSPALRPSTPAANPPFGASSSTETLAKNNNGGQQRLWFPVAAAVQAPEPEGDAAWLPGGPSVARFPDLPPEVWSRLRQAERLQQQAGSSLASPSIEQYELSDN